MPLKTDYVLGDAVSAADQNAVNAAINALATDTQWRHAESTLTNGWGLATAGAGGFIYLRRQGKRVTYVAALSGATATTGDILTFPAGFRPSAPGGVNLPFTAVANNADTVIDGAIEARGTKLVWLNIYNSPAALTNIRVGGSFPTDDAFPTDAFLADYAAV